MVSLCLGSPTLSCASSRRFAALGFIGQGTGRMPAFRGHSGKASLDTAFKDGGRDLHYQVSYGGQGGSVVVRSSWRTTVPVRV